MYDEPPEVYDYYIKCDYCEEMFLTNKNYPQHKIIDNKIICKQCEEKQMTELQVREQQNLAMTSLSPQEVLSQIKQIQDLMNSAMKEGEHYGKIPGTNKPTLLKAGAEKLGFMFRLSPQFEIERVENLQNGHREYIVKCKLIHIPTGAVWGEGVGSCSTMESKYRWRKKKVDTGEPIPNDYKQNKGNYKAKGFVAGKDENGQWRWYKQERVENEDIADVYNTCLLYTSPSPRD